MDADRSIGDTISEIAAALTSTGDFPEWPEKLKAFSAKSPDLSCKDVGLKVVADLVETAVSGSEVFATYLANFVQALVDIYKASEDKDGVRQMVVVVLLCIFEKEELRTCSSIPEFAAELVPILLELRLKVEDDSDSVDEEMEDSQAGSDSDEEEDELQSLSEKGLAGVASEIGEENVKEIIFGHVSEYLTKDEWRYRLVALKAILKTAQYLPDEGDETLLDEIVEILKVQLNDPHRRVRSATCQAFIVLAAKYQPLFQENYAKEILPLLVNLFGNVSAKEKGYAVALFKIIAGEETEAAMPFVDQSVEDFIEQIKPENPREMREQCLRSIEIVALLSKEKFMKYYSVVVPEMKKIIVAPSTDEERAIQERAIRCFKVISEAVADEADEMVQADADEVAQVLLRQK